MGKNKLLIRNANEKDAYQIANVLFIVLFIVGYISPDLDDFGEVYSTGNISTLKFPISYVLFFYVYS